jgi:GAF domain-containing protein
LAKYQHFVQVLNELYRPLEIAPDLRASADEMLSEALLQLYRAIRIRFQLGELLRHVNEKIISGRKFPEIFDFMFESLKSVIRCDRMGVALLDAGGEKVKLQWVQAKRPVSHLKVGFSAPLLGSSLQKILTENKPRIIEDLELYLQNHPGSTSTELALKDGVRSSLTCPLISGGRPVGFLFFSSYEPNTYNHTHILLLTSVAAELSLIIDQARVWRMLG